MTAKEYLERAYNTDRRVASMSEQVARLRALAERVTVAYGGEAVAHSRNVTSMQDTVVLLMKAEEELSREIEKLRDLKKEIGSVISEVRNVDYRLILEKRYLCFLPWKRIAAEMNVSERWMFTRHKRALSVVSKLLLEKGVNQE